MSWSIDRRGGATLRAGRQSGIRLAADFAAPSSHRWRRIGANLARKFGVTAIGADASEFMPIGVFAPAKDHGPGLRRVGAPERANTARLPMNEGPGVIEIDFADGVRVRVDALVNERMLRRVLAALKACS